MGFKARKWPFLLVVFFMLSAFHIREREPQSTVTSEQARQPRTGTPLSTTRGGKMERRVRAHHLGFDTQTPQPTGLLYDGKQPFLVTNSLGK